MLTVVVDTNIIISALIMGEGNEWTILDRAFQGELRLAVSDEILDEFNEVISRPKFAVIRRDLNNAKKALNEVSLHVHPKKKLDVVRADPDDNRILECAVEAKADYIVSGDSHLLKLGEYRGIRILSSKEMLKISDKN